MFLGSLEPDTLMLGGSQVDKVMLGAEEVWKSFGGWSASGNSDSAYTDLFVSFRASTDGLGLQMYTSMGGVTDYSEVCLFDGDGNLTDGHYFSLYLWYGTAPYEFGFDIVNNKLVSYYSLNGTILTPVGEISFDPSTGKFSGETHSETDYSYAIFTTNAEGQIFFKQYTPYTQGGAVTVSAIV